MKQLAASLLPTMVVASFLLWREPVRAAQFTSPRTGYTITYPDSWNAEPGGRDVIFRNFPAWQTPEGGFVPPGGATITVASFPPYDHPYLRPGLDEYDVLDKVASGNRVISRTSRASGNPARVTSILEGANLRSTDTVIHMNGRVFLFILECNADDPQASAYEQIMNDIITGTTIVGATPEATVVDRGRHNTHSNRRRSGKPEDSPSHGQGP